MNVEQNQTWDELLSNDIYKEQKQQILEEFLSNDMYQLNKICKFLVMKKSVPQMYEDDLYSIARWTFLESLQTYNPTKECKFKTYLIKSIWKAFYDWTRDSTRLRRCNLETNRDGKIVKDEKKNPIIIPDISIDAPTEDGIDLSERVASDFTIENAISDNIGFSLDEKVEEYLESLPKKAREIIKMKMDDFSIGEIKQKLELTDGEYTQYMNIAKTNEKLELFTKSCNYKEDDTVFGVMPIDTTDNYRMDKHSLGILLDEKRDGDINCKYILQRKAFQWTKKQKNKFLTRVLNNQPIPEIVICEQYVNKKKKRHLIDGLQRLSYAGLYRAKGTVIELDGAEFYEIQYEEKIIDESGNFVLDEDGDIKKETKVFNVIGKKFDELPKFLQDRFNKFNINVTTYFDCTDEQIAYHIRNYNNHEGMTGNQYEVTNIDIEMAKMIKDISCGHSFFKDRCGSYTEKNDTKGILERVVVESIMTMNFIDDWKKKPEDAYKYVNENSKESMFDDFKDSLDRLCDIVNKENRLLFNTTNSPVWFAVFSRFKKLNVSDDKFLSFINYFAELLKDMNSSEYKKFLSNTYKSSNTKDKNIVIAKINGIEKMMLEFLHIEKKDTVSVDNQSNNISKEAKELEVIDFVKNIVNPDVTEDDINFYEEMLGDYTVEVDNSSSLLNKQNKLSLIALIAHACESDIDLDDWIVDFFRRNNTYITNQKENYIHMRQDLDKFITRKAA